MKLTEESRSTRGKICLSATLSTINPTWTDPGSNPGVRGRRPATNRLEPWHGLCRDSLNCEQAATVPLSHCALSAVKHKES